MEVDIDLRLLSDGDELKDIYHPADGTAFSGVCDTISIHPNLGVVEMPVYVLNVSPCHPLLKGTEYNALRFNLKCTGGVYIDCTGVADWKRSLRVRSGENSSRIEVTLVASETVFRVTCNQCSVVDLKPTCIQEDCY